MLLLGMVKRFIPKHIWLGKSLPTSVLHDRNARDLYLFVQKRKGYVYVMSHPDRVGQFKIGLTTKDPFERAKTLETAGILGRFDVLWVTYYANVTWAEAEVHKLLEQYHVDKEYFSVPLSIAKETLAYVDAQENTLLQHFQKDGLLHCSFDDWYASLDIDHIVDIY